MTSLLRRSLSVFRAGPMASFGDDVGSMKPMTHQVNQAGLSIRVQVQEASPGLIRERVVHCTGMRHSNLWPAPPAILIANELDALRVCAMIVFACLTFRSQPTCCHETGSQT